MSTDGDSQNHSLTLPFILIIALITLVSTVYSTVHNPESAKLVNTTENSSTISECTSVPQEATELIRDIHSGGPFDYPSNDGRHFGNYEQVLPRENSDYYREYTVTTPGVNHRGARRIVTGGGTETDPDVYYYTDDHYESFCEMDVD
ncbi:ribonuclease [Corynebacterium tuscaniense]|uniref:Ribonuclease n=1 Tax=Corynebacterium tuscaniense TaxID=302449 RepID=A0A2N6T384_9CORY|nr:ribonuclease domain-containing protein [Corynebacterium tuscaniense]KAA8735165.1 ribonuclease [Corynebacterium tuscaniense]PMC63773.1 ribonuclease [Corynebacterium tuscaniense]